MRTALPCIRVFMNGLRRLKLIGQEYEEGSGRSSTSTTNMKTQQTREAPLHRVAIEEAPCFRQTDHGSTYEIFPDMLCFSKVCERWVPRDITEAHLDICQRLLDRYRDEDETFFERVHIGYMRLGSTNLGKNPNCRVWRKKNTPTKNT